MPMKEKSGWVLLEKVTERLMQQAEQIFSKTVDPALLKEGKLSRRSLGWHGYKRPQPWSGDSFPDLTFYRDGAECYTSSIILIEVTQGLVEVRDPRWMESIEQFVERWEQERNDLLEKLLSEVKQEFGDLPQPFRAMGESRVVTIIEGY